MRRALRFGVLLFVGLACLTWTATLVASRTARSWFEKDVALRAQLAVAGVRSSLALGWRTGERAAVQELLSELTLDDRLTAAAAYGPDLRLFASTEHFPPVLLKEGLGRQAREAVELSPGRWTAWHAKVALPHRHLQASAFPVFDGKSPLGFVILLHNLDYIDRRTAQVRQWLLAAFGLLSLAASVSTVLAARLAFRESIEAFRRVLRGEAPAPEFRPLLDDMRELVERVRAEEEADSGGKWTPERLKQVLGSKLEGERILIVANREPYMHHKAPDGTIAVRHPASGLVTALEPVMRACSGTWIAHGSGSADRESCDAQSRVRVPPGEESYAIRRVWLGAEEEKGYYYGFSNEGLWPLCHVAHQRPVFRSEDWHSYEAVNLKFARAVQEEADSENPVVLVQDYHFALAPRFLREALPKATLISFWHIPWPDAERIGICPWRRELLEGMLGSSILGFHTRAHCNNFLDAVDRYLEARIDREDIAVVYQGHATAVRPYPISIEWPSHWARATPPAADCRAQVRAELGVGPAALLGVGVDRLDYTKGIEERLLAVGRLLERYPEMRGRFSFVQLAAPSRTAIEAYRLLGERVEGLAEQLNRQYGQPGYRPVILARSHHEPEEVFRFYRAADLCYVSSLHDGMNLVAKEFVAARDDEQGVLILSQFTGASRELVGALTVNPYDLDEAAGAMLAALTMNPAEQRARLRSMRLLISEFNVYRWAGRMLVDAARLRQRERLAGHLYGRLGWERTSHA